PARDIQGLRGLYFDHAWNLIRRFHQYGRSPCGTYHTAMPQIKRAHYCAAARMQGLRRAGLRLAAQLPTRCWGWSSRGESPCTSTKTKPAVATVLSLVPRQSYRVADTNPGD